MSDRKLLRKDIKDLVCNLASELDIDFTSEGFKRKKNSLIYTRKTGSTIQKINMVFYSNPSYHDAALAHIYPWMEIYFPGIGNTAESLLDNAVLIGWLKKFTLRQPIQIYTHIESWYLLYDHDYAEVKAEISSFLYEYTFPLLNVLKCEEDYLALYEKMDNRLIWDDQQYISVASAYINRQEYEKAYQVIEKRFGKLGARKRYGKAFDFFNDKI